MKQTKTAIDKENVFNIRGLRDKGNNSYVVELTKFYRDTSRVSALEKSTAKLRTDLEQAYPDLSAMSASDDTIIHFLPKVSKNENSNYTEKDAYSFLDTREKMRKLYARLDSLSVTADDWAKLCLHDCRMIQIYAVRAYDSTVLDSAILETDKTDKNGKPLKLDFKPGLNDFLDGFYCDSITDLKNVCNRALGNAPQDSLFKAIHFSMKDFDSHYVVNFWGYFTGHASINSKGRFCYDNKITEKRVCKAFTILLSVLLDNGCGKWSSK